MRVLITGATGLIGKELTTQLITKGIRVNYLSTSKQKLKKTEMENGFYWNPKQNEIDIEAFNDVEVIINLAGASLAKRWTNNWKKEIKQSRIQSVNLLYQTIKNNNIPIKQFISASAIGYYPYSLTKYYEEAYKSTSNAFVSDIVQCWEAEVNKFESLSIIVTKIRIGIVLSTEGGALPQLVKPIKNYVGAVLGSGKQWQSWIHISDMVNMFVFILEQKLKGVYNGVAPNPVTQKTLTKAIAKAINKPLLLPKVPVFVLQLLLGEMNELVVKGQRVSAKKIEDQGFDFKFHTIEAALDDLL